MNVRELIEELEQYCGGDEVYFVHPAHDYVGTQLVSPARCIDTRDTTYSANHRQRTTFLSGTARTRTILLSSYELDFEED